MNEAAENCLLTVEEMARADALAIEQGISGERLMEAAGKAVADCVLRKEFERIVVLCGPGNNGGDGFVAARYLSEAGKRVRLCLLGTVDRLKGDARVNADRWTGEIEEFSADFMTDADCVVDAIFGAGLARNVEGKAREAIEAIGDRYCVAVDIPSGIHGDTGEIMGTAPTANKTVTFFRFKPGHFTFPGRGHCGELELVDIGIPKTVLPEIDPTHWLNSPNLWRAEFPWPKSSHHKYSRGHAVVVGGSDMTGAARLAVQSAMRVGTGIVTVAVPNEAATIYKLSLPGAIIKAVRDTGTFREVIEDSRISACLVGPGNGVNVGTREKALAVLRQRLPVVMDADALSVFEETRDLLFSNIESPCLLTPHEGEFSRLFSFKGDKISRARDAAKSTEASILLKGADTILAAPDGRIVINSNGPPDLATAGAGDVLAGLAVGLLAQGCLPFEAGCIAAWLHGEAAQAFGPGLIAEDLPNMLPGVLKSLKETE